MNFRRKGHNYTFFGRKITKNVTKIEYYSKPKKQVQNVGKQYAIPVLLANCAEASEGFVSAGNTAVCDKNGDLVAQLDTENEGFFIYDSNTQEAIVINF